MNYHPSPISHSTWYMKLFFFHVLQTWSRVCSTHTIKEVTGGLGIHKKPSANCNWRTEVSLHWHHNCMLVASYGMVIINRYCYVSCEKWIEEFLEYFLWMLRILESLITKPNCSLAAGFSCSFVTMRNTLKPEHQYGSSSTSSMLYFFLSFIGSTFKGEDYQNM
jgi:hypothetical protein